MGNVFFSNNKNDLIIVNESESVVLEREFEFTYKVGIPEIPDSTKNITIHIPLPQTNNHQIISDLIINSPYKYSIYHDADYHNKILFLNISDSVPKELNLSIQFMIQRKAVFKENYAGVKSNIEKYLLPDNKVPIDGIIAEETHQLINNEMEDMEKAKIIYDHLVKTIEYDKSGDGWGNGDALYACEIRKGNCTDFHSLFNAESRAVKIPSRFVIGFMLPEGKTEGQISGYHCWAEFYLKDKGWIPVDVS